MKLEHRSIKVNSSKTIEITSIGSNYHIECNPSDCGNNDRYVIQEVIKEIASHSNISFNAPAASSSSSNSKQFKVVVLTEADRLSKQAQAGLRRTMEKYSAQCRIILMCNSPSKIIEPLRSRCLSIRVPAATNDEITDIITAIGRKENITITRELAMKISIASDRNMRRALLMFESMRVQAGTTILADDTPIQLPDWEIYIVKLARDVMSEQSPTKLILARDMLYELLTNCIPADVIIQTLTREFMKALDDTLKHEVAHWAAYYEHRIRLGSKEIFHLEAFLAKFMAIYKKWLVQMFAM